MSDDEFVKELGQAMAGDINSCFFIISLYQAKIEKESIINGQIDYECVAYIQDKLLAEIKKFKNFK